MNKILSLILLLCAVSSTWGQTVESFMEDVGRYNPQINAARELLSAGEAESVTGLTPDDPKVNLGYFPGNEYSPGNKITWGISQSFDFPTKYARIKSLKESNLELARMEFSLACVQIMSEARSAAIEYINLVNTRSTAENRIVSINRLEEAYSKLLGNGETTLIEYNKIRIKQVELLSGLATINNEIDILKTRLDFLSGNNSDDLSGHAYPDLEEKELTLLMDELRSYHPAFIIPSLRTSSASNAVALSASGSLPSFELGFGSEIVADQRFTGPSAGISLPLWQNRGMVKKARADSDYQLKLAESEILMLESVYSGYFRSYISTRENIIVIEEALTASSNSDLLLKALEAGEISLTEYLMELESVYKLEDLLLSLKKDKYLLLSKLNELDFRIN